MTEATPLRTLWAIDPNERNDSALHHRARKLIRRILLTSPESIVEPVYVLRMSTAISADLGSMWRAEIMHSAEDAMRAFLRHTKIPGLTAPKVLISTSSSYRKAASVLGDHAGRMGADLIVAQTHGRTGFGRMVLGSFAETLLLTSEIPVLLVNPKTEVSRSITNILFPTDFGRASANQLREVIEIADRFRAKITLFHALELETESLLVSSMIGPSPMLPQLQTDRAAWATKRARKWIRVARHHGVEMEFVLRKHVRDPGQEIVNAAKASGAGLIAMQSNSGPLSAALLGSTTRAVVRKAPCPIWILKPRPGHHERLLRSPRDRAASSDLRSSPHA